MTFKGKQYLLIMATLFGIWASGCADEASEIEGQLSEVEIQSALTSNTHDVSGFLFEIQCNNGFVYSEYVPLEDEVIPGWIDPFAGGEHLFSDLFAVIDAPAQCVVRAIPMQDPETRSEECEPVMDKFTVYPEQTTEIVLMAECRGEPTGAGDIVAGLNNPPVIVDLDLSPSKFICTGEKLEIKVAAEDPDGDDISYHFAVTTWPGQPAPGTWSLTLDPSAEYHATFTATTPGYYEVTVTVTDIYGASSQLTFPVHVSECDVCCYIEEKDIFLTIENEMICRKMHGIVVADERCDESPEVCCELPENEFAYLSANECRQQGGNPTPNAKLCEEICCEWKGQTGMWHNFDDLGHCLATSGHVVPRSQCEEIKDVCCQLLTGAIAIVEEQKCHEQGGHIIPMDECRDVPMICCVLNNGAFDYVSEKDCEAKGGAYADLGRCEMECCFNKETGEFFEVVVGDCNFTVVDSQRCR